MTTEIKRGTAERSRSAHLISHVLLIIISLIVIFASPMRATAQIDTGGVAGTVKDSTGAAIPGAKITLTNQATSVAASTESSSTGRYVFVAVPVGVYTLRTDFKGFKTYVEQDIQIHIQNTVTADVTLVPGSVTEQVTVTSAVPLLQAQDASLGQTVPDVQVNDLPLNGRNWLSLAQLSAGSYTGENSSPDNPGAIYANGANNNQVDFRLNGIDDNNEVFGGFNVAPAPDAIQEFKLQDGNNSAEFGQFAGAVVNAAIKSGTNQLNGDVWEYLRNEALNANDYFSNQHGVRRQKYRQNQFGGTIGGPIVIPGLYHGKDKTFFFFDYQHTGITHAAQFTETVPTNAMRSSAFTNLQDLITSNNGTATDALNRKFNFGTVMDPATTRSVAPGQQDPVSGFTNSSSKTIYVRDPFYSGGSVAGIKDFTGLTQYLNTLPANRLDPNAVALLNLLPAPTITTGMHNNYFATPPATQSVDQYDLRLDENVDPSDLLFGVFSRSVADSASYQPFPGIAGGALGIAPNDHEPHYEMALSYTHIFSPTLINEARGGYDHMGHFLTMPTGQQMGIPGKYGIQGIPQIPNNGGLPTLSVSGLSDFGGRRFMPTIQTTTGLQFLDNLTKTFNSHEFKAGFAFNHIRGNIIQPANSKGQFGFSGKYSDIADKSNGLTGIADMLLLPGPATVQNGISDLGGLSTYIGSNYAGTKYFSDYIAGYAQDNWRVTSRLTLNLGVRWEYFSPFSENDGREANFIATGGNGNSGTYFMPKKGCAVARSSTFDALLAGYNIKLDCLDGLSVNKSQTTNFGPRLGFAYRLLPNFVIRGGYGISYGAFDSVGYGGTLGTNYPFQYQVSNPSTTSETPDFIPNTTQVATMESTFGVIDLQNPSIINGKGLSLSGKQYDYKTPYIQSLNLMTQYQFTQRDSFQVGYVGSLGRHLDSYGRHNAPTQILPKSVNQTSYLPFPNLAPNSQFLETRSISSYHSLQSTYEHQFKDNFVLLANYTYGKCMSDEGGELSKGYRAEWLPGFGIRPDYSLCRMDAVHVVHASGEYQLPFGRGNRFFSDSGRVMNTIIAGWNFNYIYSYQSGQPFTVGCPVGTTSDFGCNANLVPGQNPYAGPHNQLQWLNPNAFAQPASATAIGQSDYSVLGGKAQQVRGPGFYNLDASLFKSFATGEGTNLEFRLETFNVLNHAQFNNPGQLNFKNLSSFSQITGTRNNPRLGQLALKFMF